MKSKSTLTLGLLVLGLAAGARAEENKINVPGSAPAQAKAAAAPAAPAPVQAPAYNETQVLEALGWIASKNIQLESFGFTPAELESVLKGIAVGAAGKDLPFDKEKMGPLVGQYVQKKQQETMDRLKKQGVADTAAFLAKLKENKNVTELPSGLRYEILKQGTGAFPKANETVKVHYVGTLINGTTFDSSVQRGEPAEFPLDGVIPGWTEGIQKVAKGGKIKLYVPPHLAYGDDGRPGIPPASTLIFEVELLDIKAAAAPAAPAAPAPTPAPAAK